jgi:transcriptional regulator with PAS, ATPase and Fis domain
VAEGHFREDFFYRINVIILHIPPLRKRKDDIPLLVEHFLNKYSQQTAKMVDHVNGEGVRLLQSYDWPGNVRELENAVERAVVLAKARTLRSEDFAFLRSSPPSQARPGSLKELERRHIQEVLEDCDWNVTKAGKVLDVNRVTLHKMIKRFGLKRP